MEYGAPGDKSVRDGWLNRYLAGDERPGGARGGVPRPRAAGAPAALAARRLPGPRRARSRMGFAGRRGDDEDVLDLFDPLYKAPPSMDAARHDGRARRTRTT